MSNEIDNHIVRMSLENGGFEQKASQTMDTLEKLKSKLNLGNVADGFEQLESASNKVSLHGLSNAVQNISDRFTNLGIIGITALTNIANKAVNVGETMLKSLTIAPISQGWGEYELKMGSIQTIMAGTGESLETVADYLDELNHYADKTIYSFSDMTSNIGKFTNAGVSLDRSVAAIQGISNAAALAGASSQNASHAMYNFAQALSSGYVKLIDWKSIEVANMATKDFKQELLDTAEALGTVVKNGDEYVSVTTNANGSTSKAFNATKDFNDSLQYQWMTTDVLVATLAKYSDETTEVGKKAFKAATEVKTFSMMMDALKEAVGSGWASTWENIFGDFEEGKELWTRINDVVSGVIENQSEMRNNFLKGWKDLGGRTSTIEGLANIFKMLGSAVKAVGSGFTDIFPGTTSEQFANFSKRFESFTKSVTLSDSALKNIKDTAKGVFSVFKIGYQIISPFVSSAIKLADFILPPIADAFLSVTGAAGRAVSAFESLNRKTKIFNKISVFVENIVGNLLQPFRILFQVVRNYFNKLGNIDLSDFESLLEIFMSYLDDATVYINDWFLKSKAAVTNFINTISNLDISEVREFVDDLLRSFTPISGIYLGFKNALNLIKESFVSSISSLRDTWGRACAELNKTDFGIDVSKVFSGFNSGLFTVILASLAGFTSKLNSFGKRLRESTKSFTDVVENIGGVLKSLQQDIQAGTLIKIASAIGILSGSIVILSFIDKDKMATAVSSITVMLSDLIGSLYVLSNFGTKTGLKIQSAAMAMITIGIAIGVLAGSIYKLSKLHPEELGVGLLGLLSLLAGLSGSVMLLNGRSKGILKISIAMIAISGSIKILAGAMDNLSELNVSSILKGLGAITFMLAAMAGFVATMQKVKIRVKNLVGILLIAESVRILSMAINEMSSSLGPDALAAVGVMAAVWAMIAVTIKFIGSSSNKGVIKAATAMVILASSIKIFGSSLTEMNNVDWEDIGKELALLIGILAALSVATKVSSKHAITTASGLLILSAAVTVIAKSMKDMGSLSWEEVGKGLLIVIGSLGAMSLALNAAKGTISGSVAISVLTGALLALSPALKLIGTMKITEIGKALLALAGTFVVLGVSAKVLEPLTRTIFKLGTSVLVLGAGLALAGVGVLAFSVGISGLAASTALLGTTITTVLTAIAYSIPIILTQLGYGIVSFANVIAEGAPVAANALVAIARAIVHAAPELADCFFELVTDALSILVKYVPNIVSLVSDLIVKTFDALTENIPAMTQAAFNFLGSMVDSIFKYIGPLDVGKVLTLVAAIAAIVGCFVLLSAASGTIKKSIPALLIMGAFLAGVTLLFTSLTAIPSDSLISTAISISAFILALSGAMTLVSMVPITGAILGAVGLVAFTVIFGAALTAIGALFNWVGSDLDTSLDKGVEVFGKIGSAIGSFVGGLIGGSMSGVLNAFIDTIPRFGGAIEHLGVSIKTFGETTSSSISSNVMSSVLHLAVIMAILTSANILDGVTAWMQKGDKVVNFVNDLKILGPGIVDFADSVSDLKDTSNLEAASNAGLALAALVKALPRDGGYLQSFFGSVDVTKFADGLPKIGTAISEFAANVENLKTEDVETGVRAGELISGFIDGFKSLKTGGVVQMWEGNVDYMHFTAWLPDVGTAIKQFGDNVDGLKEENVTAGTNAGRLIANFIDNFEGLKTGGVEQWWNGTVNYTDFGDNLPKLGTALKDFGDNVEGIKEENVKAGVNAGKLISGLIDNLPTEGGWWDKLWSGDKTTLGDFGWEISELARGLASFINVADDINVEKVESATKIVSTLTDFINVLTGNDGGGVLSEFSKSLSQVGDMGITKFSEAFNNSYDTLYKAVFNYLAGISDAIDESSPIINNHAGQYMAKLVNKFKGYDDDFKMAANNAIAAFTNVIINAKEDIQTDYINTFDGVVVYLQDETGYLATLYKNLGIFVIGCTRSGILSMSEIVKSDIYSMLDEGAQEAFSIQGKYKRAGAYAALGFKNGIQAMMNDVTNAAKNMGLNSYNALCESLDIHSPSGLTRSAGKNGYGLGFALGITDSIPVVNESLNSFEANVTRKLSDFSKKLTKIGTESSITNKKRALVHQAIDDATAVNKAFQDEIDFSTYSEYQKNRLDDVEHHEKAGKEAAEAYTESVATGIKEGSTAVNKEMDDITAAIIRGEWGNGEERIRRLTEAGYDYKTEQAKVNQALGYISSTVNAVATSSGETLSNALTTAVADTKFSDSEQNQLSTDIGSSLTDAMSDIDTDNVNLDTDNLKEQLGSLFITEELSNYGIDLGAIDTYGDEELSNKISSLFGNMDVGIDSDTLFGNVDTSGLESIKDALGTDLSLDELQNLFNNLDLSNVDTNDLDLSADLQLTPVVDMTDLQNGINVDSYLSGTDWSELSSVVNGGTSTNLSNSFTSTVDLSGVIDGIENIRSDLKQYTNKLSDMVVVLDDGTLVGKILPQIDAGLGARSVNTKRGN